MPRSVGGAAAAGLEAGFQMGLQVDKLGEEKRARAFQESRQLDADRRAEEETRIRRGRESRAERHETTGRVYQLLKDRQGEIVTAARGAQEAGGPLPPELAEEYGRNAETLGRIRQESLNYFSRLQTGQTDLNSTKADELYMHFTAATGMRPEELPKVQGYVNDVQAGLETGNKGLMLQGVNGLMAPQLKKGIGGPSPYGGTIIRKEIVGLDPARDANGQDHPDKFIPRLRVYVQTDDGQTKYYDAPVTKNRSTDPDDPVVAVGIGDAMDWMGNLGTLAAATQHPEIAAKLAEGGKAAGAKAQKYLDELTAASRPTKKTTTRKNTDLGDRVLVEEEDSTGKVVSSRELKKGAAPKVFPPRSAGGGGARGAVQAKLDAIEEDFNAGDIDEAERAEQRKAVLTGIKPAKAATSKQPTNAEVNSAVRDAVKIAAGKEGMEYDATLKQWRNQDGTPLTGPQKQRLSSMEESAIKAVRNKAAEGKRPTGDDVAAAAGSAKAPKYQEGQTATGPGGKKLIFKGGAWQPLQ